MNIEVLLMLNGKYCLIISDSNLGFDLNFYLSKEESEHLHLALADEKPCSDDNCSCWKAGYQWKREEQD